MIDRIIVEYLDKNKRLVVPGLGAFVRKDASDIVFVEFLKKDDGVLSSIIATEMGVSADEAMSVIVNYVNVVSRQLRSSGRFLIEGLGELELNANGVCNLTYNTVAENAAAPAPVIANVSAQAVSDVVASEPMKVVEPKEPVVVAKVVTPDPVAPAQPEPYVAPRIVPNPFEVRPPKPQQLESQVVKQSQTTQTTQQLQTVSQPQVQPVSQQQPVSQAQTAPASDRKRNIAGPVSVKPKRKMDTVMLLAIIVAVIAIISLLYGLVAGSQNNNNLFDSDIEVVESIAADSVVQK